ncbi:hypothetical protein Tco_1074984 [Tanacetum coccineum]
MFFNDLDLLEYSSFISSACRRTHYKHTAEDDLEVFSTEYTSLDWISAHNFPTLLQKLSLYASDHLEVNELVAFVIKDIEAIYNVIEDEPHYITKALEAEVVAAKVEVVVEMVEEEAPWSEEVEVDLLNVRWIRRRV